MNQEFICGSNKYEIHRATNTIGLSISLDNLPEIIQAEGHALYLPAPFHVSLFYIGLLVDKYNISIPDFVDKVISDFCEFTKTNDIKITSFKNDEYKFVDRDNSKKTVIVMCEVSNLNKFFDFINKKYDLSIKYPTPHVTIYNTLKGEPGVRLMDSEDIKSFTTSIENPIGRSL